MATDYEGARIYKFEPRKNKEKDSSSPDREIAENSESHKVLEFPHTPQHEIAKLRALQDDAKAQIDTAFKLIAGYEEALSVALGEDAQSKLKNQIEQERGKMLRLQETVRSLHFEIEKQERIKASEQGWEHG